MSDPGTLARWSICTGAKTPVFPAVSDDFRPLIASGVLALVLLFGAVAGWAMQVELAGAIIADGIVVVDSNIKKIQHSNGGIIGEICVTDGDRVQDGDLLVRLDDTIARAGLQIVAGQLDELAIRKARLAAERDDAPKVVVPDGYAARGSEPAIAEIIASELSLFESRRKALAGRRAQLTERIGQLRQQIEGLEAQNRAKERELTLIERELAGLYVLRNQKLVTSIKVTSLEREAARLSGERGQLISANAEVRARISETELQLIQLRHDLISEVSKELRDIQARQNELGERRMAAEDQLRRTEIRSPLAGTVHQLTVHTVGGVVNPAEPMMMIVPAGDSLVIDARIVPHSIDHVRVGQTAMIRFPAFNQRTTPEFPGEVQRVAADLTRESQTGQSYYVARIVLGNATLARMGSLKLLPGMPAEVHIKVADRTALSYLMKPLSDQIARAFAEP